MNGSTPAVIGELMRAQADAYGDKPAFIDQAGRITSFRVFNQRVNRLNHALAGLGVRQGERVAILSRNRPEYVEAYGVAKSGLIGVPLNWRLAPAELLRLLNHSAPQVLIADAHFAAAVQALRPQLGSVRHFVALDEAGPGWLAYEALLAAAADDEPTAAVAPEDVLYLMYTSGTTGQPKGVATTHAAALDNAAVTARHMMALQPQDVSLVVMPLFHVGGMWFHCFVSYACGCTTVVLPEFEPAAVLAAIERHAVTNIHLVPTMVGAVLVHPGLAEARLDSVDMVFYGASSMPADLLRRAMRAFAGCRFAQGYGSTEGGVITALLPADHLRASQPGQEALLGSCGSPLPGRALRLIDERGHRVPDGDIGEVTVRHDGLMRGYWNDAAATGRAFDAEGWFRTGDLGRLDQRGFLYIVDRKNDMVITGGENVYPTEVEQCLHEHPAVLEAAVFGVPDARWVERVVAAVVLRPGVQATPDELMASLRARLAAYKCPKQMFVLEALPKSAVGKILRKELRARYADLSGAVVAAGRTP